MSESTADPPFGRSYAQLLHIADAAITAADLIGDQELFTLPGDTPAAEASARLQQLGFTRAPLKDVPIREFVAADDLTEAGTVADARQPIDESLCVEETRPLSEALDRLRDHPIVFVRHRQHVTGVLTRADLEQPAVSLVVLGLIISSEKALDRLIETRGEGSWLNLLSIGRRRQVEERFADLQDHDADLWPVNCLNLDDRLSLASKLNLHTDLGFTSKSELRCWKSEVGRTRDLLAHGNTLLTRYRVPADALDFLGRLRGFTATAWRAADEATLA